MRPSPLDPARSSASAPARPRRRALARALALTALAWTAGMAACGGSSFTAADDGGAGADAGPDVAPDAPAGGGDAGSGSHWCSGRPELFCEDFDETNDVSALLGSWSNFEQSNGTFALDTMGSPPSPPNALRVTGADRAQVLVVKTFKPFASTPSRVRLEFALKVRSPGNVGYLSAVGFAAIAFGNAIDDGYAAMAIGNGPALAAVWAQAADAGPNDAGPLQASSAQGAFPSSGVWAGRFAIEVDYSGGGGCVQIYQGPTALLSHCMLLPDGLSSPRVFSIALGDYTGGFGSTGNVDLEFDDVTFDAPH